MDGGINVHEPFSLKTSILWHRFRVIAFLNCYSIMYKALHISVLRRVWPQADES